MRSLPLLGVILQSKQPNIPRPTLFRSQMSRSTVNSAGGLATQSIANVFLGREPTTGAGILKASGYLLTLVIG